MLTRLIYRFILLALITNAFEVSSAGQPFQRSSDITVTVRITRQSLNRFIPSHALGAAIDGHEKGDIDRLLTPANIREMLSAGLKPLTYRLRTELAGDAWHWNPSGTWSDAAHKQGYWISNSSLAQPISLSYGYQLPRRGNTTDQANDDGYSRLDDGDLESFWKSNPYLDQHFTGEINAKHAQWIVVDFTVPKPINAVRLLWGIPFATSYEIQYATFDDISDLSFNPPGMWRTFPHGRVLDGTGDQTLIKLSSVPVKARFVRILMTRASGKPPENATDVRDALGYAMREVYVGRVNRNGEFHDEVRHIADRRQTLFYVSSTDPWHREIDLDEAVEQPGFDRIFESGLTNGLPMLTPTGLLYDTPDNAAAEIAYLRSRGYPVERVELGEEPDGQYVTPEDYGALYVQFAEAIHKVDAKLQLGGPSFQEILPDQNERPLKLGNSAWLQRFLKYLQSRGKLNDYAFFSFEWYPFDDVCDPVPPQLAQATGMMSWALRDLEHRGLPRTIPWIISEYGYSAFASRADISIEGALLNADIAGRFLTLGGDQAYLYGYTPGQVVKEVECSAGNNMLFSIDNQGNMRHRFATYYGAQMVTQQWVQPIDDWHKVFPATLRLKEPRGESLVTAYAVYRPDGLWSLLVINKDPEHEYEVRVRFYDETKARLSAFNPLDLYQFSSVQYELNNDPDRPYPIRSNPPEHISLKKSSAATVALPSYSLSVIRGSGPRPRL